MSASPAWRKLLDEVDAHASGQKHVDRVGGGRGYPGQLGGIVELVKRHVDLIGDLSLEGGLEAGKRVPARLIVWRDQINLLDAAFLGVLTRHGKHLVILVGGHEEIWIALLAREIRGAGIGADQDGAAFGRRLHDGLQDVGENRADDEFGLVPLHQRLDLGDGDIRLELVVRYDHVGFASAELAAEILHRQSEAIAQLLPENRRRSRQRRDQANFQLVLLLVLRLRRGDEEQYHARGNNNAVCGLHACLRLVQLTGKVQRNRKPPPKRVTVMAVLVTAIHVFLPRKASRG